MSLSLSVCDSTGNTVLKSYERVNDHDVNYDAYTQYINENYPDLHIMDLEGHVKHTANYEQCIQRDWQVLNERHVSMYDGLKNPDDIWDQMCKKVHQFGFIATYARICTKLESGYNHVFTFDEFSHIYPFMKSCTGNALNLRRLLKLPVNSSKLFDASRLYGDESKFVNFVHKQPEHNKNFKNITLLRRSVFNETRVFKEETDNPPGSEWTRLSVESETVEMKDSYRKRDDDDDGYAIYEKYLFCINKYCPGKMKIVLDCVHNLVFVSMINPHFKCLESHKRHVFDVVRKLFIIHGADLELIDQLYFSIPRKYGLSFVEAWVSLDEIKPLILHDYTPSFFNYEYNYENMPGVSWSSTKTRGNVLESFKTGGDGEIGSVRDWKRRKIQRSKDSATTLLVSHDRTNYKIQDWSSDIVRFDEFGDYVLRDEWEFHLTQDKNEKLREIYRLWRKDYYETDDYMIGIFGEGGFPYSKSFLYENFFKGNAKYKNVFLVIDKYLTSEELSTTFLKVMKSTYTRISRDSINLITYLMNKQAIVNSNVFPIVKNPARYIVPYPMNLKLRNLDDTKITTRNEEILICSSVKDFINSDHIVIYGFSKQAVVHPIHLENTEYKHPKFSIFKNFRDKSRFFTEVERMYPHTFRNRFLLECESMGVEKKFERTEFDHFAHRSSELSRMYDSLKRLGIPFPRKEDHNYSSSQDSSGVKMDCSGKTTVLFMKYKVCYEYCDAFLVVDSLESHKIKNVFDKLLLQRTNERKLELYNITELNIGTTNAKIREIQFGECELKTNFLRRETRFELLISIIVQAFNEKSLKEQNIIHLPRVKANYYDKFELKSGSEVVARTVGSARLFIKRENELLDLLAENKQYWCDETIQPANPNGNAVLFALSTIAFSFRSRNVTEEEKSELVDILRFLSSEKKDTKSFDQKPRRSVLELVKELNRWIDSETCNY